MTGAYTRRGVVILVVLAMALSVAAPVMGAATVTPDDDGTSGTTFGDDLDESDDTNGSTTDDGSSDDSDGGLLDDSGDSDGSPGSDGTDDSTESSGSDGGSDDSSGDDSDGLSVSDDDSDGESDSGDSSLDEDDSSGDDSSLDEDDSSGDDSSLEDDGNQSSDGAEGDWSIPELNGMHSTAEVAGTEATVSVSAAELDEASITPETLFDIDRSVAGTATDTGSTLSASTYELEVADLSESDTDALLKVEATGGALTTTTGSIGSTTGTVERVGASLETLDGSGSASSTGESAPSTGGSSSTTTASVNAARLGDGDRATGPTAGGASDIGTGASDADRGAGDSAPAAVGVQQPDRQALDLSVPTDGLPVPSDPAGLGIALGATGLAAAVRQSTALSGMASGLATTMGTTASTMPGSGALERLVRMLAPFRYSRYDDSDPLEHEARDAMFEVVEDSPGTYLSEIADRADIPLSTARHHIRVLEREDLVSGAKVRGKRRFYPAYTDGIELAAAMNDDSTAAIIDALARIGAASVSDLADELGRDPSTISHHVQRLEEDDVIVRERDGRAVMNRLSPAARTMLDPEESPSESPTAGEAMASD